MTFTPKMKYIFVCLFVFLLIPVFAQKGSYNQYSEEEEYDYSENNYNNDYYERYSEAEYKRRNERFYKKSYKEEDLYNGGYRNRNYADNNTNGSSVGGWTLFNFNKNNSNQPTNDIPDNEPKKFNRYDGIENGVSEVKDPKGSIFNEASGSFEPGKGQEKPGDDEDSKTVPPPPDEPDVPVDTAIPFLILAGVLLVILKNSPNKKAMV
jgi:hypothetical protein